MRLERLDLGHKGFLSGRLKESGTFLSEFSFANLFLFRKQHDYHLLEYRKEFFIVGKTYDGFQFFMPIKKLDKYPYNILLEVAADYDFIFPIPEEWLDAFDGQTVQSEFQEGDSDYVYSVEKMSTYRGQKLHGKKNLLNQFISLYTPYEEALTLFKREDAFNILEDWQNDVAEEKDSTDYYPCREAIELFEELELCGGLYYVDQEPAGFIIGEELNGTMFAYHFAKGKRKFKGLYQYMYNHFAKCLPAHYDKLNFEQDLGKLALRIAKTSYYPERIMHKYRVKLLDPVFQGRPGVQKGAGDG